MEIAAKMAGFDSSAKPSDRAETALASKFRVEGLVLPRDIDEVEAAFVRCHDLWRRSPGGGRWPFAGDGPWHLIQGEAGDYVDTAPALVPTVGGGDRIVQVPVTRTPRAPLDRAEVAERDAVNAWLQLIDSEDDRRLVWAATCQLHRGEGRVPWKAIRGWLKLDRSPDALVLRYRKALAGVACRLQGWPMRRVRAMAG